MCTLIDSIVYEKMCSSLNNKRLKKGIMQASPIEQTSCLEGFHSVLNQFSPKMIGYSYRGMYCRYYLTQAILCRFYMILSIFFLHSLCTSHASTILKICCKSTLTIMYSNCCAMHFQFSIFYFLQACDCNYAF